jgi:hypothetical protein
MAASALTIDDEALINSLSMPTLNLDMLPPTRSENQAEAAGSRGQTGMETGRTATTQSGNTRTQGGNSSTLRQNEPAPPETGNPLLDGDEDAAPALNQAAARDTAPASFGLELPDYNPLLD